MMVTRPESSYVTTTWPWVSMAPADDGSPPAAANPTSLLGYGVGLIIPDAHFD
jgi:hypothetical protein